jgi:hypothetical protein
MGGAVDFRLGVTREGFVKEMENGADLFGVVLGFLRSSFAVFASDFNLPGEE